MKALIVVYSYHHKNTEKLARRMAEALNAPVLTPQQADPGQVAAYGLVGFGSGIYDAMHHKNLLELADSLPQAEGKKAFLFSTDGMPRLLVKNEALLRDKMIKDHAPLRERLTAKGYEIIGEYNCAGFNTNSFLKLFGGLNRGRPDAEDLARATEFAQKLKQA